MKNDCLYTMIEEGKLRYGGAVRNGTLWHAQIPEKGDSRALILRNSLYNDYLDVLFSTKTKKVPPAIEYLPGSISVYALLDGNEIVCYDTEKDGGRNAFSKMVKKKKIKRVNEAEAMRPRTISGVPVYIIE